MSGKNLTFKLVLDADNKGLVSTAKNSETVMKAVFDSIKSESDKLKQATESASKEIGNIVPKGTSELADKLTQSLTSATGIIKDAGDNAKSTAGNFTDFGNKAEKALSQLKSDLTQAKQKLQEFSATNASPADIEKAKLQVDQLEKEVQQADQAFNNFQTEVGKANSSLKETDAASERVKLGFSNLKSAVGLLTAGLAALGLGLTVKELIQISDETQQMNARLRNATETTEEYNLVQERLLALANATYRPLQEAQEVYLATAGVMKSLGYNIQEILSATESLSLSFTHNATRADQAQAAQDALAKSMAKGAVDADAWMSIITGADNVVKDMAISTGKTEAEIRKLGAEGKASLSDLVNALIQSRDRNKELAEGMENSTADAMQKVRNNITALISKMNEQYDVSSRLAGMIESLGGNLEWVEVLFHDVMAAIDELSASFGLVDGSVFEALKNSVSAAYDVVKDLVKVAYDLGVTVADVLSTSIDNSLAVFSSFTGEATKAGEQVSFLERIFQGLSIVFGFVSDGLSALGIVLKLSTGNFYYLASAANKALAAITWGDTSKQFSANADETMRKAKEWYAEADKDAQEFSSKGVARLKEAANVQAEVNSQTLAESKANLEKLLSDQDAELSGKKATEAMKILAVQQYAEAAIKANGGVIDGTMQADLMAKGYIVTLDEAGKVSVKAWGDASQATEQSKEAIEKAKKADEEYLAYQKQAVIERALLEKQIEEAKKTGNLNALKSAQDSITAINTREQELSAARDQRAIEAQKGVGETGKAAERAFNEASETASRFGIDLNQATNRVSEAFSSSGKDVIELGVRLEKAGIVGKQAGDITYQAWLKWLETAKSQAEIDFAKAKLKEFGDQGKVSTSQVEQGLIAIKMQAQKLPDDIDPVTEAFKRLGIQTKENLKLAAQQALMDYITIRDSGKATAEGIEKAYQKAAQSAAASGDVGVIAATNAANAGRNLEIQIDSTGKASVKSMDELTSANDRVRNSAERIGDGYRHAGNIAREEAQSVKSEWEQAIDAAQASTDKFRAEMKRQGESLSKGIYDYNSYSKADVLSQLKSKGYNDKEAEKLAGSIWSEAMAADRSAKEQGLGKDGSLAVKALINAEFNNAASKGLTTQHGTNKINDLLNQMTASNLVSTSPSAKPVDVNSLAPNVSTPVASPTTTNASKAVNYNISFGGQMLSLSGSAEQESMMNQLISQLKTQAKST